MNMQGHASLLDSSAVRNVVVDAAGAVTVAVSSSAGTVANSGNYGSKTVAATATPEVLAASTACVWVQIQALAANTGFITVGIGATPGPATGQGVRLSANDVVSYDLSNLNLVWLRTSVLGEGVSYNYGAVV